MITKYHRPTKIDKAEYLSLWLADVESGSEIWAQISKTVEEPNWVRLGNLFELFMKTYEPEAPRDNHVTINWHGAIDDWANAMNQQDINGH